VTLHAGSAIVNIAKEYLGVPYRYGGKNPKEGFDCSGFTGFVYREAGYGELARSADGQYDTLHPVSPPQPGDLLFFKIKGDRISHVGIYAGDLKFIHAPRTGKSVSYADLRNPYWKKRYAGARSLFAR
jgi:cell wall-associated NlpC family hydrolase